MSARPLRVVIATAFGREPDAPRGGVESVSTNLVRALARQSDLDLHVVTADPGVAEVSQAHWEGATIHRLPRTSRHMLTSTRGADRARLTTYIDRLRPDVLHAHDVYGLTLSRMPCPRVMTIHGFIHKDTLHGAGRWAALRSRVWRKAEVAAWADFPHLIAISPYVRERLAGLGKAVIHDIENPIDSRFFEVCQRRGRPTIFSAALLSERKNTLTLIDAFAQLVHNGVDAQLRLAGTAPEPWYGVQAARRIRDHGLADRVSLLGRIGSQQIRDELSRASVFALVSLEENAPMGVEEAMAAGVPVITSNRCGMPYMVRDGESGFLVEPHDVCQIADRLGRLLTNEELRGRCGARAKAFAYERFHADVVARRTLRVYTDALGVSLDDATRRHVAGPSTVEAVTRW